jgi:predicted site-specific integrase-resolvase
MSRNSEKYLGKVLSEGTIRAKIDDILNTKDRRFHMPTSRREIIKEIVAEFENMGKDSIEKLMTKISEKSNDPKVIKVRDDLAHLKPEVVEAMDKLQARFGEVLGNDEESVEDFVKEMLAELANFSDAEIKQVVELENRMAIALK